MHWERLFRNIFSNWVSYVVTALIGFYLAPRVLHSLGNAGYGLWTLVLSLTGCFGLLDLGIRSSVGRFVARYIELRDEENLNRTANSALAILSVGGILALAATLVAVVFLFDSFKVEPHLRPTGKIALLITGLNISCILPLGVFSAVLIALDRFDILSGVTLVSEITRAVLVIAVLRSGQGLIGLAAVTLLVSAIQYGLIALVVRRLYPPLRLGIRFVDRAMITEVFGFGIYRFVWSVANQLIFYSHSVVIGIFLGAAAITPFAIAAAVMNYGRNVVSLVTDTFYPTATRMDARGDLEGLQRLLVWGTRASMLVALPICTGLLFFGEHFIGLWMGKAHTGSAALLSVLTISLIGAMSQSVSALILAGMARHRVLTYLALAEGIVNVALSVLLIQRFGLLGVAWGAVVPGVLFTGIAVPVYTLRVLRLDVRRYVMDALVRPAACMVPAAAVAFALSRTVRNPSWGNFFAEVAAVVVVFGILSYFFCLDSRQRANLHDRLASVMNREPSIHEV